MPVVSSTKAFGLTHLFCYPSTKRNLRPYSKSRISIPRHGVIWITIECAIYRLVPDMRLHCQWGWIEMSQEISPSASVDRSIMAAQKGRGSTTRPWNSNQIEVLARLIRRRLDSGNDRYAVGVAIEAHCQVYQPTYCGRPTLLEAPDWHRQSTSPCHMETVCENSAKRNRSQGRYLPSES